MDSGEGNRADGDVTTGSVLSESSSSSPIDDHGSSQPTTEENSEVESEGVDSQPPTTVRKKWANPLPPCRVCASPSSGLHYGVNTCESCKAFFKRCLKRKRPLQCKGRKNCKVHGKKRDICAYCRYQWCTTAGMSRDSIKLGRYTYSKREDDSKEVTRLSAVSPLFLSYSQLDELTSALMAAHSRVLTNWDIPDITMLQLAKAKKEQIDLEKELYGHSRELTFEEYDQIYRQTGLDVDGREKFLLDYAQLLEQHVKGFVHFAKGIPGFRHLPLGDQASLLKASRAELWFLGVYKGFVYEYQTYVTPSAACLHLNEDAPTLGAELAHLEYDMARKMKRRLQPLTREEIVLLKGICLTSSDRCDALTEREKVEDIHWKLTCALITSLRRNHAGRAREDVVDGSGSDVCRGKGSDAPEFVRSDVGRVGADSRLFWYIVDCLVELRTLTETEKKAHEKTPLALDIMKNNPILVEVMFQ